MCMRSGVVWCACVVYVCVWAYKADKTEGENREIETKGDRDRHRETKRERERLT